MTYIRFYEGRGVKEKTENLVLKLVLCQWYILLTIICKFNDFSSLS